MIKFSIMIEQHTNDMHRINEQRRWWLVASSIVFSGTIFIIFFWDWISGFNEKSIWWVIVSLMLVICMNWWYWTMSLVKQLMEHHTNSIKVIKSLISDINTVRSDLKDIDKFD